jgi:hypothetical protein
MYHNLILNHIKTTLLGVFYKKKLKKYIFFRIIVNFIFWRIIYLSLTNLFFLIIKNQYLVNLNLKFNYEIIKQLKNQNKFRIKVKTTNLSKPDLNNLFRINSIIQKYKIFNLEKIKIIKNSDFFFSNNKIFHHEFYNFHKDYTSEELHGIAKINFFKTKIKFLNFKKNLYYLKGAIFTHPCSQSYFHWLTEILPRIYLFSKLKKYENYPIFIDEGLNKNILKSLKLVLNKNRKIILVKANTYIHIKNAVYVNPLTYIPFEPRNFFSGTSFSCGLIDQYSSSKLRDIIIKKINPKKKIRYKKIYLDRENSTYRSIINYNDVINYYKKQGYKIIRMEKLSFDDQVYIISKADFIAGPTGASFASLLFCKKRAKVTLLMPKNYHSAYFLWANLSRFLDIEMNIVACKTKIKFYSFFSKMHADYFVEIDDLKN